MTAEKKGLIRSKKRVLTLAGASGILAVIVDLIFTNLAVLYSPGAFSLTQNWYSDLGGMGYQYFLDVSRPVVNSYTTELLLRFGQLITGVLAIIFGLGLYYDENAPSYRLGAVFAALGGVGFIGVAIFPEPVVLAHLVAAYVMFLSVATTALLIGGALLDSSRPRLGLLAIVLGIIAFLATAFVSDARGAAELLWALTGLVLFVVFSIKMLRNASRLT